MKKIVKYVIMLFFLFGVYQIIGMAGGMMLSHDDQIASTSPSKPQNIISSLSPFASDKKFRKEEIQNLIDDRYFLNLKLKRFNTVFKETYLDIETSLFLPLQHFILGKIDLSFSRYIGIVVMEPGSGRILAMVGFDKADPYNNPCTNSRFPAASLFKIVTAAAAIEKCGFDSDSEIEFFGRKHTLYKSQLKKVSKRKTRTITLEDSFAQSVNPVFGKLGIHHIGKITLEEYAGLFGFNQNIPFEIPIDTSIFSLPDEEPYHLAEIASGFNRETIISPIHGALMVSAILNKGLLISPTIVDRIRDEKGNLLYQNHSIILNRAITHRSSEILYELMKATISSGTCRKVFKGYQDDEILSKLYIGGKTGTINSRTKENYHYDWFAGFAEEKKGAEKIAISICVAHEKYIGIRANQYAKMIIEKYFGYKKRP